MRSTVDPDRYLGTVTQVTPSTAQANLPFATARPERRRLAQGAVGDFVFIDCELVKLLGRIVEVRIPDGERLSVEPSLGTPADPHPIGRIQLLATLEPGATTLRRGLKTHPRVGDAVFLADHTLLAELVSATADSGPCSIALGTLDAASGVTVRLSPEKLFGRHCGIFGATGGGKSWTIATLLAEIKKAGGKAILFDPTGEFANIPAIQSHYTFNAPEAGATLVHFPYRFMTEDDLFALLRPSGQSQGPKLRDAIRSLKLVTAVGQTSISGVTIRDGCVEKQSKLRAPFFQALAQYSDLVHNPLCNFEITSLPEQIKLECVWSSGQNAAAWGNVENNAVSYCETLIARIQMYINSTELSCIFKRHGNSLVDEIERFVSSDTQDVLRVSFRNVRFEHNTREILMNVIGRFLLSKAREDKFRDAPLVVFLDEAHQFLGRTIGDEYASVRLEAFGLIAKEGRKYGLTCVLATQRPRDVPIDVLSQLGTLIVHRLTNDQDREAVERACGDLDRNAALFIPTLAPGEAIVIGPDIPAPVPVMIQRPLAPPDSKGPPYSTYWAARRATAENAASIFD